MLLIGTIRVVAESRANGQSCIRLVLMDDGSRTDGRWGGNPQHAGWTSRVDHRRRVDSGHPDSYLVVLEQIRNKGVEVDVMFRIVKEGYLVMIPTLVSWGNNIVSLQITYAWNSASRISMGKP